jgi:hypothetical protein
MEFGHEVKSFDDLIEPNDLPDDGDQQQANEGAHRKLWSVFGVGIR